MKKIKLLGLLLLLLVTLLSCSKDGELTPNSTSSILPKKMNYIENIDQEKIGKDTYFTYDGNKIVSEITDGRWKSVYTYTGDLITKIQSFDYDELYYTTEYTYSNGKLISRFIKNIKTQQPYSYMTNYVHNLDGTVSYSSNSGNGKLTFKDGKLINDGSTTYEYDTKNNPFKNILGINVLSLDDDSEVSFIDVSKNNRVKSTENGYSVKNTIAYKANGYPTKVKEYYNDNMTGYASFKYYYE